MSHAGLPEMALSPTGAARQLLERREAYPTALQAELRSLDIEDGEANLAWQLCQLVQVSTADRDALVTLVARSLAQVRQGSTRMPIGDAERAVLSKVPELVGVRGERKPLIVDRGFLYHERLLACEERVAGAIAARAAQGNGFSDGMVTAALDDVLATARPRPSSEQGDVVRAALTRRLAVVSGGPGTGKTTIALAVARALVRLGVPPSGLALTAPTGKAASRLEDAFRAGLQGLEHARDQELHAACPAAQTLHRLLGFSPSTGRFRQHEHNRLTAQVVVADEGSMIDLALMDRLLRSLRDDAILVLLGDANQLPSVSAGAVFRDLEGLAVRLRQGFRMQSAQPAGRAVAECAAAVREGNVQQLLELVTARASADVLTFSGVECLPSGQREDLLEHWYRSRICALPGWQDLVDSEFAVEAGRFSPADEARLDQLHAHLQRYRVLCATRRLPGGADLANEQLHHLHREGSKGQGSKGQGSKGQGSRGLAPGEPVLVLRNDYDHGLWNGDQGVVVKAREPGRLARPMAAFPAPASTSSGARWIAFDPCLLGDTLDLAFALTVHKAQGSECEQAILLLPDTPMPILSRELLYTAMTRARSGVVLCGANDVLAVAAATPLLRSSGVAERLSDALR